MFDFFTRKKDLEIFKLLTLVSILNTEVRLRHQYFTIPKEKYEADKEKIDKAYKDYFKHINKLKTKLGYDGFGVWEE